jgi:uncharacterized membrane protein
MGEIHVEEAPYVSGGIDWTAFVLSFKGVLLEGMEIAIIVVSFGATAGYTGTALIGGVAAIVMTGFVGFALKGPVVRIPRSLLQLIVGTLLTSFGTFWALEGVGVSWPQSDLDIVALIVVYAAAAVAYIGLEKRSRRLVLGVA